MDIQTPFCRYCKGLVYFEPGYTIGDDGVAHEECLELSGDDLGAIKEFYKSKDAQADYISYFM